jgi:leucyl aminopeptidase
VDISVVAGDITGTKADAIIISCFEDTKRTEGVLADLDKALGSAISGMIKNGEIKGKSSEVNVIYSLGKVPANKIAVLGLGKQSELNPDKIRSAMAVVCRVLRRKNAGSLAAVAIGAGVAGITAESSSQALTEGAILGLYTFKKHITRESEQAEVKSLTIVGTARNLAALKRGAEKGRIFAEATNRARDMVNEPGNGMTPKVLAEASVMLAQTYGLEIKIIEKDESAKMGMGAFLGVARGSSEPPKFITLRYSGGKPGAPDIALIGKGITFDTGGISLKPAEAMDEMKGDMAGGAAVINAMTAIAQIKPKINVLAVVAATENMPGSNALKPGDVLTAMNGKTIEIISTDAEGRLTLADAIGYARQQGAKKIIDIATLTGGCRVALGDVCSGAFTNNQEFLDSVIAAGAEAGERFWQLPMYEEYKDQNKSEVADLKNSGGRLASPITAAQFIAEFAGDVPWVHLDIAGTNMTDKERKYFVKGATGVTVRALINLVINLAEK